MGQFPQDGLFGPWMSKIWSSSRTAGHCKVDLTIISLCPHSRNQISAKTSELLIFRNFDLRHENSSNSVIFFAYENWQSLLGDGWENLVWNHSFVAKFWSKSKRFKILKFGHLLPPRLWVPVAPPQKKFFDVKAFWLPSNLPNLNLHTTLTPLWYRFPIENREILQRGMIAHLPRVN